MPGKRSNGEGTLRKRSNGLWECTMMVGYKDDGTRRYKSFYGKSQKEAKDKADAYKQEVAAGRLGFHLFRKADGILVNQVVGLRLVHDLVEHTPAFCQVGYQAGSKHGQGQAPHWPTQDRYQRSGRACVRKALLNFSAAACRTSS